MKRFKNIFLITFIYLMLIQSGCQYNTADKLWKLSGMTMGTFYNISIVKETSDKNVEFIKKVHSGIEKVLRRVNKQMSTYIKDSEISTFNRFKSTEPFPVSEDLAFVTESAISISGETDGAFDITVGPLVNLWGFGPGNRPMKVPTAAQIADAMQKTGYENLSVSVDPPALQKKNVDIYCDLSAIAKGYGVDAVCRYLDSLNIPDYLVEIGGEVRVKGLSHLKREWRIGISTPDNNMGIQKTLKISGVAVATSGDYHNYFEQDGIRYSHTIDPSTGKPIKHKLASVTVIHDNCMMADGYATAIDVMGPEKGLAFAKAKHLPVFLIVKSDIGFKEIMTPEFAKYVVE